jgi:osmotically inducible lipoprotein OsmB
MKPISLKVSMILGLLALAACGQSTGDRALSGGAIGAGAGAVGGALMGSPGTGALLGGALGAGAGALTSPSQIDLGKPVWER